MVLLLLPNNYVSVCSSEYIIQYNMIYNIYNIMYVYFNDVACE